MTAAMERAGGSEDFSGRVAFVTGAGSGIGRAAALAFADRRAHVCLADLDIGTARKVADEIDRAGGRADAFELDTSDSDWVAATVAEVRRRGGRIDFAFNNVGTNAIGPVAELAVEQWERVVAVNLSGTFYCLRAELQVMLAEGHGAIVNNSAGLGVLSQPGSAAYAASKAAVNQLTQVAALDYAADGIRVNAICPGQVETPRLQHMPEDERLYLQSLHPMERSGRPEEIASAAVWLCSDASSYVTGALLAVDGGFTAGKANRRWR